MATAGTLADRPHGRHAQTHHALPLLQRSRCSARPSPATSERRLALARRRRAAVTRLLPRGQLARLTPLTSDLPPWTRRLSARMRPSSIREGRKKQRTPDTGLWYSVKR